MQYLIKQKKKSRRQGHRKRNKIVEVALPGEKEGDEAKYLDWSEYKAIRQYQTMGDILDELRVHGYENLTEEFYSKEVEGNSTRNGHMWLTMEP